MRTIIFGLGYLVMLILILIEFIFFGTLYNMFLFGIYHFMFECVLEIADDMHLNYKNVYLNENKQQMIHIKNIFMKKIYFLINK